MPTAHFFLTARPPRVLPTLWALPTPPSPRAGVQGKTSCTLTTERCRLQPVKAKLLRGCFASLDRFPAPSASVSFATPTEMERGSRATKSSHFTLDALNRPNTHRRGRWIGLPPAPAASQVRVGFGGKAPRACFLFFEVVRVDVTVQKRSKKCAFLESLLLKKHRKFGQFLTPTPTLTGGE